MKRLYFTPIIMVLTTSCATMNESLELGGSMGALTGATATFVAHKSTSGESPAFGSVALGAGVGAIAGLVTSYFTHKNVEERRQSLQAEQTEMFFGDLPPSPFVVPKMSVKKGSR